MKTKGFVFLSIISVLVYFLGTSYLLDVVKSSSKETYEITSFLVTRVLVDLGFGIVLGFLFYLWNRSLIGHWFFDSSRVYLLVIGIIIVVFHVLTIYSVLENPFVTSDLYDTMIRLVTMITGLLPFLLVRKIQNEE